MDRDSWPAVSVVRYDGPPTPLPTGKQLFTFLRCFGLDATNNAAERAIRGMVIARKVWGGNRTWEGAHTQQILVSVLRTCWQQGKDAFTRCVRLLRAPRAVILDTVPGTG